MAGHQVGAQPLPKAVLINVTKAVTEMNKNLMFLFLEKIFSGRVKLINIISLQL